MCDAHSIGHKIIIYGERHYVPKLVLVLLYVDEDLSIIYKYILVLSIPIEYIRYSNAVKRIFAQNCPE